MAPSETAGIELSFTELRVVDSARAVRWYVEILELRLVLEDLEQQFALLEAGGARLALRGGGDPSLSPRRVRLVFQVGDVDAERNRLQTLGIEVGPPVDNRREGYRGISLRDPEETPLTLFSWRDYGVPVEAT